MAFKPTNQSKLNRTLRSIERLGIKEKPLRWTRKEERERETTNVDSQKYNINYSQIRNMNVVVIHNFVLKNAQSRCIYDAYLPIQ